MAADDLTQDENQLPSAKRPISPQEMLGMALISLATPLAGGLIGGKEGAMIGAQAGLKGSGTYLGERSDAAKKEVESDKKLADAIALAKEKGEVEKDVETTKATAKAAHAKPKTDKYMDASGNIRKGVVGDDGHVVQDPENDAIVTPAKAPKDKSLGTVMQDKDTGQWFHWDGKAMVPVTIAGAPAPAAPLATSPSAASADTPAASTAPSSEPPKTPTLVKPGGKGDKGDDGKDLKELATKLKGASRDPLGIAKGKVMAAERIEGLLKKYPDGNLPPNMMQALTLDVATMMAPGVPTESMIHELQADTISGSWAKIAQKFANRPIGSDQGAFVKDMADLVEEQKDIAREQQRREAAALVVGFPGAKKKDPKAWENLIRANFLTPDDFDDNGGYKGAKVHPRDVTPEQAAAEIERRKKAKAKADGGGNT